jgi:ABC-type phosphate/phosphonate transport system substrate-binding protein
MRTRTITAGLLAAAVLTLTACSSDSTDEKAVDAPPYKVVEQETRGAARYIAVEVDSTERLEDVFTAVAQDLTDEAGYHIRINCSTGGTDKEEPRLGNGKKAVGNLGQAATGLDDGETEFTPLKGRTCP